MIFPNFSVVTPSYNQGAYIEACIKSVLNNEYPNIEYCVVDGGSSDESAAIIKKYSHALHYWVSEPDAGQYAAIHKGFENSTGEIMAWLNADDIYMPWTMRIVAKIFSTFPELKWITSKYPLVLNEFGDVVHLRNNEGYHHEAFYRGRNLPHKKGFYSCFVQQESTFWRRSLWEKAGGSMDLNLRYAGDFELWARFFQYEELIPIYVPLAGFRIQPNQKSGTNFPEYMDECLSVLQRYKYREPWHGELLIRRIL